MSDRVEYKKGDRVFIRNGRFYGSCGKFMNYTDTDVRIQLNTGMIINLSATSIEPQTWDDNFIHTSS